MKKPLFITCHPLISPVLSNEIKALGFPVISVSPAGVETRGLFGDTIFLNLNLTTANRVLYLIKEGRASTLHKLYHEITSVDWGRILPVSGYFTVNSVVKQQGIRDFRIVNLKVKDAVVDRMRKDYGKRPNTGPEIDKTVLFIHWEKDTYKLYIDTSGETISKHGYRVNPFKAPLQEALASALLKSTGWTADQPFVNPMCGSGTLAIEAALLATARAPGLYRDNYGFMHVKEYDESVYRKYQEDLRKKVTTSNVKIIASDHDHRAIKAARGNARAAGVQDMIEFHTCDFAKTPLPEPPGTIIFNPEYGERLGTIEQLTPVYKAMGDFLKGHCSGYKGYIFTGNLDLAKNIGLRTSSRTPFLNGKIECRLLEYEMYMGSKKSPSE